MKKDEKKHVKHEQAEIEKREPMVMTEPVRFLDVTVDCDFINLSVDQYKSFIKNEAKLELIERAYEQTPSYSTDRLYKMMELLFGEKKSEENA